MELVFTIGQMLTGVAVFLLGAGFMEEGLKFLAGRKFKLFLKKQTSTRLKAIWGGSIVTGVLQSSSVVNLLILSLTGAGVIALKNALAVSMGANLGTTFDSWIVATLGFKFEIEKFAFILAGITGISIAFFKPDTKWYHGLRFTLGLSLLFVGLGFIKASMKELEGTIDFSTISHWPAIAFLGIGILLTSIIQSSSATVAITLSAIYSNAISLYEGMALVLGAELGSTIKLFLASARGIKEKKQLALGSFIFNGVMVVLMFVLLRPIFLLITDTLGFKDELIALVFFQSTMNIVTIILFFPFLDKFAAFLEKRYVYQDDDSFYISKVNPAETDMAMEALEKETPGFLAHVIALSAYAFEGRKEIWTKGLNEKFVDGTINEKYEFIKRYHGQVHNFFTQLQVGSLSEEAVKRTEQLIAATRNGMYAAKNIKDALADIHQLQNSSNDKKYGYYQEVRKNVIRFCKDAMTLINSKEENKSQSVHDLYKLIQDGYNKELNKLYRESGAKQLKEDEVSTLFNFNREIFTAYKSIVFALKDLLLNTTEADAFDELPGFIR